MRWPRSSGWSRSCRAASASSGPATSYQERAAGAQTPLLYTLSLLVVFLCLAALYESWTMPTAVLLVVPLGILGRGAGEHAARAWSATSTSRWRC